jgi:hypothetical protein
MKNKDVILLEKLYTLIQPTRLDEVKWEEDFPDAKRECITPDAVAKQLNDELKRLETPSPKRSKPNINFPLISKGNIPDNANVENFKRQLMLMPKTIFDVGLKSGHTVDETIMTVNTGIPALRAVIWDEENKEFYVINTCPSAGSCISNCYARHGFYIMNDGKNIKLINRLQLLMNHPDLYESKAYSELELFAFDAKRKGKTLEIRWNDAGDFFSNKYLDIAISITKKLTINGYKVESYAYTKVADMYNKGVSAGMIMNFSDGAKESDRSKLQNEKDVKMSFIIPTRVFSQFLKTLRNGRFEKDVETGKTIFKDSESKEKIRRAVFDYLKETPKLTEHQKSQLSLDTILYTDELPSQIGNPYQYNVIVLPAGDSDRPAQRKDVRFTLLGQH